MSRYPGMLRVRAAARPPVRTCNRGRGPYAPAGMLSNGASYRPASRLTRYSAFMLRAAATPTLRASGAQQGHQQQEEQQGGALQNDAPAHQLIGSRWIAIALGKANQAGEQYAQGGKHQQGHAKREKRLHRGDVGSGIG